MSDEAEKGTAGIANGGEVFTSSPTRTTEIDPTGGLDIEDPPDGGYGWVCCGAVSLLNGCTWGVVASSGVLISNWLDGDYYPGATATDYALVAGLIFGCALLFSPLWTILTREVGRRPVMLSGCVMMSGGYIAASFATRIWHLYLALGMLVGTGVGAIFIPSVQVVPQWFLKRRSLAGGIASAGSGFGGLAFSLGIDATIRHLSLAWALRITGLVAFGGNLIGALLIRDRNHLVKPPQLGFATHLLRRYDCLLLLAWGATNLLGYMVILYSVSSYATQVVHLSQARAGLLTAVLNLGTAFGRPASGLLADRYGRVEVSFALTFGCGISVLALWIPASGYALLMVFTFVSGAILGGFWLSIGPLCAEIAGLKEVPSFLSLCWLAVVLPTTFGEAIGLYLRKPAMLRFAYLYPQLFAAIAYLVASVFLAELWRVRRVERAESLRPDTRRPMGPLRQWMYRYRP